MATQLSAEHPAAPLSRKQRKRIKQASLRKIGSAVQRQHDAIISAHVTPEARVHGDYVVERLPGPTIITKGQEQLTRSKVVRNRGGTAIERWQARGDLDGDKLNAIQAYQSAWHLFLEPKRVTANWSLAGGTGSVAGGEERNVVAKLHAKELLRFIDDEVFFGKPLTYFDVWQNVVIHDEAAGVAGSRLGFKNDGAEAAAKAIVLMLAGEIAIALQVRSRRKPQ
ncbi:hypothetical protein O4H52_07980 [Sphingomonadaceae bacterium G21617-S1]|nr:hypothetical protein [Sphingomonadaceae bacterium G21617-S1]